MAEIILGLAGELASGKGTVSKYIAEKHQGSTHRFSTMLRDILHRLHLEESRDDMQRLSTALRQTFGEDTLARVMAEDTKNDVNKIVVVDGVRRLADIKYLQELSHFKLVYIEADIETRYQRLVKRGENTDDKSKTFEEFKKDHERETELQIKDLKNHAAFVVDNNGAIEGLYRQVDDVIRKCKN